MNLNEWTQAGKNPDGTRTSSRPPTRTCRAWATSGFQYHGNMVWFKNVKIKSFD